MLYSKAVFVSDVGRTMNRLELDAIVAQSVDLDLLLASLDTKCQNLSHLVIESNKCTDLSLLDNISSSLKTLKLTVNPYKCDLKLIAKFKSLTCLSISNTSSISDIIGNSECTILSGIFSLGNLETLTLEGFKALKLIAIGARSGKLVHLKQIALRRMMDYSLEHVRLVASKLTCLQYFEIDDTYDLLNEIDDIFFSLSASFENIFFTSLPLLP